MIATKLHIIGRVLLALLMLAATYTATLHVFSSNPPYSIWWRLVWACAAISCVYWTIINLRIVWSRTRI